MKKLTMNRLAFAGIKANKKDYSLLCVGVFLAVFFAVGTLLGLDILFQKYQHRSDISQTETTFEALKSVLSLNASLALAGTFLLLAATLGIFSASGGQFQRKEEQYRMLRTIGATRRQIRAISSREAVVLALMTAPLGCLSALLFVEILRKAFPESLPYPARPVWLLVGCLGALLLVWLAARLPGLVYRPQHTDARPFFPLHSRKTYRLPALWSRRTLRFHPFRSGCAMVLIALFCLASVLFADTLPLPFLDVIDARYIEILLAVRRRRLLFWGGVTGMFLLLAVLEIQGDLRRQLQAERRSLGILRAVGCNEQALCAMYTQQIAIFTLGGNLLALGLYRLGQLLEENFDLGAGLFWSIKPQLALPTLLATAAALLGINVWLLKRELGRFVQSSVIENIREE